MNIAARAMQSTVDTFDQKAAILQESRLEAACDVLISRLQDELREAKRTSSSDFVIDMHITNIEAACKRRDGHRAKIIAFRQRT